MAMPFMRFKKDDGSDYPDWDKSCIKNIGHCIAGATPSTKYNDYWDNGSIPWLSSGEVNKGQIFDTDKKITQLGYDNCSTKMVKANSVIIAMAGQGKTRGMVGITRIPLCTNQSLCSIELFGNVLSDYLYQYLKTRYIDLRNLSSGNDARGGLNLEIIHNFEVKYPCPEEQQKIADFFSDIDTQINNYQQSLDNLESQKKELLRQIFSQKLRFTKDDGSDYPNWEEKSFDKLYNSFPNKSYQVQTNDYLKFGKYPIIDQGKDYYAGFSNIESKVCYKIPAIIFGDHTTIVKYIDKPFIIGADGVKTLAIMTDISKYGYYLLSANTVKPEGYKRHFSLQKEKNLFTSIDKEEQQKIADFFSDFDERIELERKRLQTMQEIKKGLLQQMFC